jgi:hypothetical protein
MFILELVVWSSNRLTATRPWHCIIRKHLDIKDINWWLSHWPSRKLPNLVVSKLLEPSYQPSYYRQNSVLPVMIETRMCNFFFFPFSFIVVLQAAVVTGGFRKMPRMVFNLEEMKSSILRYT